MHFELGDQHARIDQLCMELEALTNDLQAATEGASSATKKLRETEQREAAAVKLAASRQNEICALKTQLGDLGHLANELRAKLELQEAERAF